MMTMINRLDAWMTKKSNFFSTKEERDQFARCWGVRDNVHLCDSVQYQQGCKNWVVDFQRHYSLRGHNVPIKTPPPKTTAEQQAEPRKETLKRPEEPKKDNLK